MNEFVPFPKIGRLSRDIVITEKIDGTNAVIEIGQDGSFLLGSRTRWIPDGQDNHGFAKWARAHRDELVAGLGVGRHFGEWWGSGIERGYGISDKRLSLFNVKRWNAANTPPSCCSVVPVLWRGNFDTAEILRVMDVLRETGSRASPGFMRPEGVVIYHTQSAVLFKKTFEKDDAGKGREPEPEMMA